MRADSRSSVLVTLAAILIILFISGQHAFERFGVGFLWTDQWDPVRDLYGAWPFIYGTLVTSTVALFFAVPASLGLALFLTQMAPARVRALVAFPIGLLAGIPSVVYGLWGLFVLAPLLRHQVEPWLAAAWSEACNVCRVRRTFNEASVYFRS